MLRLAPLSTFALSLCLAACGTASGGSGGGGGSTSSTSSSSSSSSSIGGPTCGALGGTCVPDPGQCHGSFSGHSEETSFGCVQFGPGGCCFPQADTCTCTVDAVCVCHSGFTEMPSGRCGK